MLELTQQGLGTAKEQNHPLEHLDALMNLRHLLASAVFAGFIEASGECAAKGVGGFACFLQGCAEGLAYIRRGLIGLDSGLGDT